VPVVVASSVVLSVDWIVKPVGKPASMPTCVPNVKSTTRLSLPLAELVGAVMTARHCGTVATPGAGIVAVPVAVLALMAGKSPVASRLYQVTEKARAAPVASVMVMVPPL